MMKRHIYPLLVAAGLLVPGLSSCDLSVINPTDVSSSTFWQDDKDVWSALNDLYADVVPGCDIYSDSYTDDVRCPYPWESNGSTFQTNGLSSAVDMGYSFVVTRRANDILEHLDGAEMDPALKERVRAEVRLLRAWNYAGLTLSFGKVPLMTERYEYTKRDIRRDDAEKVRQFVLDEMAEAAKALPKSYPGGYFQETTRLTSYAAYAILARTALNFGNYKVAEEAARQVMAGPFALHSVSAVPDGNAPEVAQIKQLVDFEALGLDEEAFVRGVYSYRSIWDADNVVTGSPECILIREYMGGNEDYADLIRYTNMRPQQMVLGWSSVVPQQPLIDAYWMADGKPYEARITTEERKTNWDEWVKEDGLVVGDDGNPIKDPSARATKLVESGKYLSLKFFDEFRNRDPRLYASILFHLHRMSDTDAGPGFIYRWQEGANNESTTGYNFIKMVAKSTSTMLWGEYPTSEANYPTIRFAEVLLTFAEAHTHNVGYDGEVVATLNRLRTRVGMPGVPERLSQSEGLDLIRNERRIELAGEGFRLNDLRRYGNNYAAKYMNDVPVVNPKGATVLTMKWDKRMMLFPIPQTAIDVNPILKEDQNPGY